MRNLKRALSLGLTAAMISGLMVMGSSAAGSTYADVADTDNVEAIEVLKAVGIMVGDDQGNFNPDATVSRNEMAVVMSNLMAYNVATYRDTSPFTDVPEWAEPYVAACYTNGITAGYDATTYGGNDAVTTAQAALMVMKALGYFQYQSDFGGDWQLSTVAQGNRIDLFTDVDSPVKEAMTRNDLAQLVLNALEAGTVEADAGSSITVGGVTITNDVKYNYITSAEDYAYAIKRLDASGSLVNSGQCIVELGEKLYLGDLTKDEDYDDFERPANIWEYEAKEVGTFAKDADYTFTAKVTSKALYNEVGRTATENYTWNVAVNGESVDYTGKDLSSNKSDNSDCFLLEAGTADAAVTGNGVITEVFVDGTDRTVDVAVYNVYAAEVYRVDEEDGTITLSDLDSGPVERSDEFESDDFAEDDIVFYTYANGDIQTVQAAEEMTGEVTRVRANTSDSDGDNFTVDGNTYNYNKTMTKDRLITENVGNDVVAYLDANDYVIYIDESAVTYDYAYVLTVNKDKDYYGDDSVYARLVLTDGTMVKAEVEYDDDVADSTTDDYADMEGHIVAYSVDKNDVYTLTAKDYDNDKNTTGTDGTRTDTAAAYLEIKNSVASFDVPNAAQNDKDDFVANSNTVFITAEGDTDKDNYDFTVYTGVKNVPDIDGKADAKVAVAADEDGVAKVVYVEDANVSGTGDVIFIRAADDAKIVGETDSSKYYEISAVVGGETTTLKVKYDSDAADMLVDLNGLTEDYVDVSTSKATRYIVAAKSITENSDGLVTSIRLYDNYDGEDGVENASTTGKAERETVKLGTSRYAWDDEVVVARYNMDAAEFDVSTIGSIKDDYNDEVLFVRADKVLTGVCVIEYKGAGEEEEENDGVDLSDLYIQEDANGDLTINTAETLSPKEVADVIKSYRDDNDITGVVYNKSTGKATITYDGGSSEEISVTVNVATEEEVTAIKMVDDAIQGVVDSDYDWVGDITINGNSVEAAGDSSYVTDPGEDKTTPATADLARFLGALYRSCGAAEIVFDDVTYTWNAASDRLGSNWENEGTTLVSAIVADIGAQLASPATTGSVTIEVDGCPMTFSINIEA